MINAKSEILKETKWEVLLRSDYVEDFNDPFIEFLFNEYYNYKSRSKLWSKDLNRVKGFLSRIVVSFCYHVCRNIDERSSSLYFYKMREAEIKTALIIEKSSFYKNSSIEMNDFKNVMLLMRNKDYDYKLLSNGGFAGVALMFDRDTLYRKASEIGRSPSYMENRYFYIGSIIKYGLIDEKTVNFVTSNLSVGMKRNACRRAMLTSENLNHLIETIKKKGESFNPTELSLKSLELKLFMTKMIIYSTIEYLQGHNKRNFFAYNMTLDDVPHLMPIVPKFDGNDRRYFFQRIDFLKAKAYNEISQ